MFKKFTMLIYPVSGRWRGGGGTKSPCHEPCYLTKFYAMGASHGNIFLADNIREILVPNNMLITYNP
jgi:hypothetical protein